MDLKKIINDTVSTDWKDLLLKIDTTALDKALNREIKVFGEDFEIFPPQNLIFNCFNHFNIKETLVILIGQDCYIGTGEAMGLCFSVPDGIKLPPSLKNIYKEIQDDIGIDTSKRNGDLTHWAKQGILLLNSALTVREGKSNSHQKFWKPYTDKLIKMISDETDGVIFILWGNNAQEKIKLIDQNKHHIIKSVHPSPLSASRGFFGQKYFSQCNDILKKNGKTEIKW